jgi:hypothetical protein
VVLKKTPFLAICKMNEFYSTFAKKGVSQFIIYHEENHFMISALHSEFASKLAIPHSVFYIS